MRVILFLGTSALAALSGCAILYSYDDYQDGGGSTGGACTEASQCPGRDTECAHRVCENGVCSFERSPEGAEADRQVAGDCKAKVCDGRGKVREMPNDADVPDDGNECTIEGCEDGEPTRRLAALDSSCGEGGRLRCNEAGRCTGCMSDAECRPGEGCVTVRCVDRACEPGRLPAGEPCAEPTCQDQQWVSSTCDENGACVETSASCSPYPCGENGCNTSCTSTDQCLPDFNCDNGSCLDCTTCAEWLDMPMLQDAFTECERSHTIVEELRSCACGTDACTLECAGLCGGLSASTDGCRTCLQEACPTAYEACTGDR